MPTELLPKLLVKIPTRERGFDWLHNYLDRSELANTVFVLTLDNDQIETVPAWVLEHEAIRCDFAPRDGKVGAVNRNVMEWMSKEQASVLLLGSDDMVPMVSGYDKIILADMAQHFPDNNGCLWYQTEDHSYGWNIKQRGTKCPPFGSPEYQRIWICMLSVLSLGWLERYGYIYHPSYQSFYCDEEFTRVAQRQNLLRCVPRQEMLIEHNHPAWNGTMKADSVYAEADKTYPQDWQNYKRRKAHSFPK